MGYMERNGPRDWKRYKMCRTQSCFSENGNPLMTTQVGARHIHICVLDKIFYGSKEDEFKGSLKPADQCGG